MLNRFKSTLQDIRRFSTMRPQFNLKIKLSQLATRALPLKLSNAPNPLKLLRTHLLNAFSHILTLKPDHKSLLRVIKSRSKTIKRAGLTLALGFYVTYHFSPTRTRISLVYDQTSEVGSLVPNLSSLTEQHFYPSFWLAGTLMQTVYSVLERLTHVTFHREYLKLSDGGQVCIDWAYPLAKIRYQDNPHKDAVYPYNPPNDNKIMLIIHGLTGGSETQYVQQMVHEAQLHGYRVAALNHRGVNQPLTSPLTTHGGDLADLEYSIDYIRAKYPDAQIVAVGCSLGGNQLMRYLGKKRNESGFVAAVSVAGPFDIDRCTDAVESTVYATAFVNRYLTHHVLPNLDILKSLEETHGVNFDEVLKSKTLREFHSKFTVKAYRHKDVGEYFRTTFVEDQTIANITTPLLCLHARDDPVVVKDGIPMNAIKANKNIVYLETGHGSHLCWFSGIIPKRWFPEPTIEFLEAMLKLRSSQKITSQ